MSEEDNLYTEWYKRGPQPEPIGPTDKDRMDWLSTEGMIRILLSIRKVNSTDGSLEMVYGFGPRIPYTHDTPADYPQWRPTLREAIDAEMERGNSR